MRLREQKISFNKIRYVLISHLHGDHVLGLPGLLSTMSLLKRQSPLQIIGPKGIKKLIETQLELTETYTPYTIDFREIEGNESQIILEDEKIWVKNIPLKHRIYTNGYLIKEKPKERKLNMDAIKDQPEIDICDYQNLKNGKDFQLENGQLIPNKNLTFDPVAPSSYAYVSDTAFKPAIVELIEGVDILYHESTFLKTEEDLAKKTGHSTAEQAAKIAEKAGAKKLVLGHFSNRYRDLNAFVEEAKTIFPHTELAYSGKLIDF